MRVLFYFALLIFFHFSCTFHPPQGSNSSVPNHAAWDELLKKYVDSEGWVNYQGLQRDSIAFNQYLEDLKSSPPDELWSEDEQLAYWINVYNAFTVKLILNHHPVEGIKNIGSSIQIPFVNSPFDIKFIEIGGVKMDLNNIEHGIIRNQFDEPRIHFAVNCASISCPKLRNEAYTGDKLDKQLTDQAWSFINDPTKNKMDPDHIRISKIFQWYTGDFTDNNSLIEYLNQYSDVPINDDAEIDYLDYDWSINSKSESP